MSPEEIRLTDVHRLLFGQAPVAFLLEVVLRSVFTYVVLLVTARLMGKRVAGQMSVMELTVMVTLGAAIGVPLQAPDRGILPAVLILLVAVAYQRGLNLWSFNSRRVELTIQGDSSTIVRDGCLDLGAMRRNVVSRERLFALLRQHGLVHLGQVRRAYLEADGHFSVYPTSDPSPGLCLVPQIDLDAFQKQFGVRDQHACRSCGNVVTRPDSPPDACGRCGSHRWSSAVRLTAFDRFASDASTDAAF
jgi:uncharacterized membrane protein YcaP (DUF421 family)